MKLIREFEYVTLSHTLGHMDFQKDAFIMQFATLHILVLNRPLCELNGFV